MKTLHKHLLASLFIATFSYSTSSSAQPDPPNSAPGFGGWQYPIADNKSHYACWNDTGSWPGELISFHQFFTGIYTLSTGMTLIPITSCPPLTDIMIDDNLADPNVFGYHLCDMAEMQIGGWLCIQGTIKQNPILITTYAIGSGLSVGNSKFKNWCHEIGHSFGFWDNYHTNSCMVQGLSNPLPPLSYNSTQAGYLTNNIQP